MQIKQSLTFEATTEQIIAALLSEELAAKRMALFGVTDYTHRIDGTTATTDATIPPEKFPSQVRGFLKSAAHVTVTQQASGNVITLSVDPHGLPAELAGTIELTAGTPTVAELVADLKVRIPIVGGKIERKASDRVGRLLARDQQLVAEVIAERG
ncbi:MAG: DUF2505 domain-containing protein [Actinomycetaceae bacterium]|nr:DUF2505 domain-containing protein [Actinomycetaceae bacterium]